MTYCLQPAELSSSRAVYPSKDTLPGLRDIGAELPSQVQLNGAVEANVRWSPYQLLETPEAEVRMYELETERLRFLP